MSWTQVTKEKPKVFDRIIGRNKNKKDEWEYFIGKYVADHGDYIVIKTDIYEPDLFETGMVNIRIGVIEWKPFNE